MKRLRFLALAWVLYPFAAFATDARDKLCAGAGKAGVDCDKGAAPLEAKITDFVNIGLFLAGALAVLALVYGGIRYVTSTGDASRIKAAKETIIYAIIGLVVTIMSYAIIRFVATAVGV